MDGDYSLQPKASETEEWHFAEGTHESSILWRSCHEYGRHQLMLVVKANLFARTE